jgi:hypothetical protein
MGAFASCGRFIGLWLFVAVEYGYLGLMASRAFH